MLFPDTDTILPPMLAVLYRNDDILILDKPAGLPVQPGAGVGTSLVDAVERQLGFHPFLMHRLDRETAGCLAVASSSRAAAFYGEILADKAITHKVYRAVVSGVPESLEGVIRDDVGVRGQLKAAETRWRLAACEGGFSLLEMELGTGRMHQIRLHLAGMGHPILGDDRHGDFALNKALAKEFGLKRLMLYAARLFLRLAAPVDAVALPPEHFVRFLERAGAANLLAACSKPAELPPGVGSP